MNTRPNRFWNISRGGFDGFRSGLRDAVSGVEQTRSRMMEYDQLLVWAILSLALIGLVTRFTSHHRSGVPGVTMSADVSVPLCCCPLYAMA